jgi:hypothetical protein
MRSSTTTKIISGERFILAETGLTWEEAHEAKHEYHHSGYKARLIDGDVWVGGPRRNIPRCCIARPPSAHVLPTLDDEHRQDMRVRFTVFPVPSRQRLTALQRSRRSAPTPQPKSKAGAA